MDATSIDSPYRRNPVFWIMWLLPAAAVIGGVASVFIALRSADRALPAAYHWEGEHLDKDFAQARAAAAYGIVVGFALDAAAGECSATLRNAPNDPPWLALSFANGADAGLDRVILVRRTLVGSYSGPCAPLPVGRWRVALEDGSGQWAIRAQVSGSPSRLELRARDPEGAS